MSFFGKFENLFKLEHLKLLNRLKLYELLQIMILLDNDIINTGLYERSFTDLVMVNKTKIYIYKNHHILYRETMKDMIIIPIY